MKSIGVIRPRKTGDLLMVGILVALALATIGVLTLAGAAALVLSAAEQVAPGCSVQTSLPPTAAQSVAHL